MFRFSKPTATEIGTKIAAAAGLPQNSSIWFESLNRLKGRKIPFGYAHDFASVRVGSGETDFAAARRLFIEWKQFNLGWIRVVNPEAAILVGQIVAVEVRTLGLWSVNLSRIVQTIDTPTQFGFVYSTTPLHAEQGEERFLLDFDPETGSVTYVLEAVSRPWNMLAKLGYPFTRAMQHRFARESLARVREVVRAERNADSGKSGS